MARTLSGLAFRFKCLLAPAPTTRSMKNFQLVAWDHNTGQAGNTPLVLFGKCLCCACSSS
jgi:hypothetical protein